MGEIYESAPDFHSVLTTFAWAGRDVQKHGLILSRIAAEMPVRKFHESDYLRGIIQQKMSNLAENVKFGRKCQSWQGSPNSIRLNAQCFILNCVWISMIKT